MSKSLNKHPTHTFDGRPIRNCLVDYVGYYIDTLFELVIDDTVLEKIEKVQCNYIYRNTEKQCISYLNSSSLRSKSGRCDLHRNAEKSLLYNDNDAIWSSVVPLARKNS